jgi:hypothetical protein
MTSIFVAKTLLSRAFLRPEAIYGVVWWLAFQIASQSVAFVSVSWSIAACHTRNHLEPIAPLVA